MKEYSCATQTSVSCYVVDEKKLLTQDGVVIQAVKPALAQVIIGWGKSFGFREGARRRCSEGDGGRLVYSESCHTLSVIITLYVSYPLYSDILFSLHRYPIVPMPLLCLWTSQGGGDRSLNTFWMLSWKLFQIGLWRVLSRGLKTRISSDRYIGKIPSWVTFRSY